MAEKQPPEELIQSVFSYLSEHGASTVEEIADELACSHGCCPSPDDARRCVRFLYLGAWLNSKPVGYRREEAYELAKPLRFSPDELETKGPTDDT
jgi:hypothetical protein